MRVEMVSPWDITVSEFNERKEEFNLGPLADSIEEQGVIQPPLVRPTDAEEYDYEVFVGQRRTLAAQGTVDEIPVIVMDADDTDALVKSISENVDAFRETVTGGDRALAITKLKKETGMTNVAVAAEFGVSEGMVRTWLDREHSDWEGTLIDPEYRGNENDIDVEKRQKVQGLDDRSIVNIRQSTGGGSEGEKVAVMAADKGLSQHDIQEVTQRVRRGADPEQAIEQVAEATSKSATAKTTHKSVHVDISVQNEQAKALRECAKDRATSENQVARDAIEDYLTREGYL